MKQLNETPQNYRARAALVDRCDHCLLPDQACVCAVRPLLASNAEFALLMHPQELGRSTNTGRLIQDCLPGSHCFIWSRVAVDPQLQALLESPLHQVYLVFPENFLRPEQTVVTELMADKIAVFLLLDATWQQARKMYRKSPCLHHLPVISLQPDKQSSYGLRRLLDPGQLCTAEVAAALLYQYESKPNALKLQAYFQLFNDRFLAARDNKPLPNSGDYDL